MTVGELIGYLAMCNQDYEVIIDGDGAIGEIQEQRTLFSTSGNDGNDGKVIIWID